MTGTDVDIPAYAQLLWHQEPPDRRGPKRSLDAEAIGSAGVRLADAGGLAALSMRAIAAEVGVSSMALYRYVSSKHELLMVVMDAAFGPAPRIAGGRRGWRAQLRDWANANHDRLLEHPWVVAIPVGEPPLLPNSVAWLERALQALAPIDLREQQKLSAILLLDVYVRGQVALSTSFAPEEVDPDAGAKYTGRLLALTDEDTHPHVHAALRAGALGDDTDFATEEFDFGLDTVLDGIAALIARHGRRP